MKNLVYHAGLPPMLIHLSKSQKRHRFTTYIHSECSLYMILVTQSIRFITFKTNHFRQMISFKPYSYKFKTATHSIQTFGLARSFNGKFGYHEKSLVFLQNAAVTAC